LAGRAREAANKDGTRESTNWEEIMSHTLQGVFDQAQANHESLVVAHELNGWKEATPYSPRNFALVNLTIYPQVLANEELFHRYTGPEGNRPPHTMTLVEMGTLIGGRSETIWPKNRTADSKSLPGRTLNGLRGLFDAYARPPSTAPTAPTMTGLTPPTPDAPAPPAPEPAPPSTPSTAAKRKPGRPKGTGKRKGNGATKGNGASRRRRGDTKTAAIRPLLTRPEGCTAADIRKLTNWPTISVQAVAKRLKLTIRQKREGRTMRYWAVAA